MKLPNAENARIDPDKLRAYLLSASHPVGRSKARFFRAVGFDLSNTALLEGALTGIARDEQIVHTASSPHGTKYLVDGPVLSPSGKTVRLRTVWIVDQGADRPRFVTAYPI